MGHDAVYQTRTWNITVREAAETVDDLNIPSIAGKSHKTGNSTTITP
jgi:hypothetical protein